MEYGMRDAFTVRDLFGVPHFEDAALLGGDAGLDVPISRVNVMEVPDVVDWVRPGEFLMTTGYPFKEDPNALVTLIAQLKQKGVVALGIKTKRFLDAVPEAAIRAADQYGIPLIELPPATTFSDVVREVMERVLVAESRDLSILQGRVQRLSHVLLHGDGLPAFLNHLQLMIKHPVALLDPENRWTASPAAEDWCVQINEEAWSGLRGEPMAETQFLRMGERQLRVHVTAVSDDGPRSFLLLIIEDGSNYGPVDALTVTWAGRLLGFEISNMQARKTIEAKYFDQFLQDWISGRVVSSVDLRLRAEACGWPLERGAAYVIGVAAMRSVKADVKKLQAIAKRLNDESALYKNAVKWTVLEGALVVLLTFRHEQGEAGVPERLIRQAWDMLQAALTGEAEALCLGREAVGTGAVPNSYKDARRAAEVRSVCRLSDTVVRFGDLGLYLLLYRLQGSDELEVYKRMYLQPLLELDTRQSGALLSTLRTYFQCNCNAKETAERMFVHYNTVNYRLERIRSELGLRLDDPETKLMLQLALKLEEIQELN
ncbi:PucR family transcriptional regulator [Paenibacillus campinasensis]|uniref:PucR family transcriptional regulator n=1 Tax=Paenibacillus campinasensis TaxID=66347 RepID=A0A268EJH4_9BACL|nr:PucR family transcriptional regulator ligand-binding domain-containing protein [Paenibacillus campinasensis]PAD73259.1 hypothetical protein CHH67_20440 [Paenibacillus campinasensis]